jgi:hypothetical protein
MRDEFWEIASKTAGNHTVITRMRLDPADFRKAVALLKIPGAHEPKLKKALSLDRLAMEKTLDAPAKELKLKTTGKNIIAALKKAKVL